MSKVVSKAASHHKARLSLVLQPDALRSVGVAMSISERLDPAPFFDNALSFIWVFEVVILGQLLDVQSSSKSRELLVPYLTRMILESPRLATYIFDPNRRTMVHVQPEYLMSSAILDRSSSIL